MAGRGGRRVELGDVRRDLAWSLVATLFFATSTWFIVTAFFNYYYTTNVTQYVVNFLSRLVGQDIMSNYTCSTSPCRIDLSSGDKVLNLTVENPTTLPLVLLLSESGGAKAAVAIYGSARLEIRFGKPLMVEPAPTNALTVASPKVIRTNETTTTLIRVSQIIEMSSLLAGISTLASLLISSALATYLSRKPLAKMYYGIGYNWYVLICITALAFIVSACTMACLVNLKGFPATVQLLLFFMVKLSYPLIFIIFKRGTAASSLKLHNKILLLNASDVFWTLWAMHWAFDPFTAISAMYWELLQGVFALLYEMALFSLLFVFPILLFTFSRLFKLRTLLLFIPFALNYELAAREGP